MIDIKQLEEASEKLLEFYQANCNIHRSIVVDCYGVKVVSDEVFIPKKQPADNDRLSVVKTQHNKITPYFLSGYNASTTQCVDSGSDL